MRQSLMFQDMPAVRSMVGGHPPCKRDPPQMLGIRAARRRALQDSQCGWVAGCSAVGPFPGLFSRGRAAIRTCRWVFLLNMSLLFSGELLRAGWPVLREALSAREAARALPRGCPPAHLPEPLLGGSHVRLGISWGDGPPGLFWCQFQAKDWAFWGPSLSLAKGLPRSSLRVP